MKPVSICVPVLRRYDKLVELLLSLRDSTVTPAGVYVIDNGANPQKLREAVAVATVPVYIDEPGKNIGVAASWNRFINATEDDRIIVNDDIKFAPDSIERLVASECDLVWAKGFGFACFVIRDACVDKLGLFDEEISPGYGYYEDDDYLQRLDGRGTKPRNATAEEVDCGVEHFHSATLKAATHEELAEHHRLFKIAQTNYINKWNLQETFK